MTAALQHPHPRPTLLVVPGGRRSSPPRAPRARSTVPPGGLPARVADEVARVLGTRFAPVARDLARRLLERAPLEVRRGRPEVWVAALAFLLAEEGRLFAYDVWTSRSSFARELGVTLPTLRRRAAEVQRLLAPLVLDLPDPDFDGELA